MASELRLRELREVQAALLSGGHTGELDLRLHGLFMQEHRGWRGAPYMTDMRHTLYLIRTAFPGFWHKSGMTHAIGWAQIGPDYDGPDFARLREEWPMAACEEGWTTEIQIKGDEEPAEYYLQPVALLACALKAEIYREERKP